MLVAVDPGLHHCGVSYWEHCRLVRAELVLNPSSSPGCGALAAAPMGWAVHKAFRAFTGRVVPDELVVELPQVYAHGRPGVASDIVDLSTVVGAVAASMGGQKQVFYRPAEWKGQVPKDVHHRRVVSALDGHEMQRIVLCRTALMHNVWDGVALGLAHLKMTGRRK